MAKPPEAPPASDIEGVTQDGTGPSRPLPSDGADAGDLDKARQESVGRPDYSDERAKDDRSN